MVIIVVVKCFGRLRIEKRAVSSIRSPILIMQELNPPHRMSNPLQSMPLIKKPQRLLNGSRLPPIIMPACHIDNLFSLVGLGKQLFCVSGIDELVFSTRDEENWACYFAHIGQNVAEVEVEPVFLLDFVD